MSLNPFVLSEDDDDLPQTKIFQQHMQERREAVQNPKLYAEYLATELKQLAEEEEQEKENARAKETYGAKAKETRGSKAKETRGSKAKRTRGAKAKETCDAKAKETRGAKAKEEIRGKKRSKQRKCGKKKICRVERDSSESEESDYSNSCSSNESIILSENEASVNPVSQSSLSIPDSSDEIQLSQKTKRMLERQHNTRAKEMAAFQLDKDFSDEDVFLYEEDQDSDPFQEINLKIRYRGKMLHKVIKKTCKFFEVFEYISKENNVPMSDIILYFNDAPIHLDSTPKELGILASDILNCVIISSNDTSVKNLNCIDVKMQCEDVKAKTIFSIHKLEPFLKVMQKYAEEKSLPLNKLIFEFDGLKILPDETPMDLDMENDSVIDIKIIK